MTLMTACQSAAQLAPFHARCGVLASSWSTFSCVCVFCCCCCLLCLAACMQSAWAKPQQQQQQEEMLGPGLPAPASLLVAAIPSTNTNTRCHLKHAFSAVLCQVLDNATFVDPDEMDFEGQEWVLPDEPRPDKVSRHLNDGCAA